MSEHAGVAANYSGLDWAMILVRCARCRDRRYDISPPPLLCELQRRPLGDGATGWEWVIVALKRRQETEWGVQEWDYVGELPVESRSRQGAAPARLSGTRHQPSRGIKLPRCRGCGREHPVRLKRLYRQADEAVEKGESAIYLGD
jgi:hypothetical protein